MKSHCWNIGNFLLLLTHAVTAATAFVPPTVAVTNNKRATTAAFHKSICVAALPTREESAAALTDYMAKAHEEKIRATAVVEAKYKDRIVELEAKVAELEQQKDSTASSSSATTTTTTTTPGSTGAVVQSGHGSYLFPATNKDLLQKVEAYRNFVKEYTVKSHIEKVTAVAATEAKLTSQYKAHIAELQMK